MLTNGSTAMVRRSSNGADAVGVACTSGAAAGAGTDAAGVSGAAAIARDAGTAEGASSLAKPPGPRSNIQPMITAIGKPSATSTITSLTDQSGRSSGGSTVEATSTMTQRSEEHTSELQSLMRNSYAVFCLKKKKTKN